MAFSICYWANYTHNGQTRGGTDRQTDILVANATQNYVAWPKATIKKTKQTTMS